MTPSTHLYSLVIALYPSDPKVTSHPSTDWRFGSIEIDVLNFTRDSIMSTRPRRRKPHTLKPSIPGSSRSTTRSDSPETLSLQPLLAHFPGPSPLSSTIASGSGTVGRGVVHLFRHAPPPHLIASLDAHPLGESSKVQAGEFAGERAEGEDGSLVAILAVPAWMRPADFLEFIGGWATCLEGVRMIR